MDHWRVSSLHLGLEKSWQARASPFNEKAQRRNANDCDEEPTRQYFVVCEYVIEKPSQRMSAGYQATNQGL